MKKYSTQAFGLFFILYTICFIQNVSAQTTEQVQNARTRLNINDSWTFYRGNLPETTVASTEYDDSGWETVHVPHTMKLSSNELDNSQDDASQPTFHRYLGWYRKKLSVSFKEGQHVMLEFEGAHQHTRLWVNGQYVGAHKVSGFTPFHFDITNYVYKDGTENTIVLSVDNRLDTTIPPDGSIRDYLLMSGLYRDVYLVVKNPLHLTFDWEDQLAGVFITTPTVDKNNATISIRSTVRNMQSKDVKCQIVQRIVDKDGYVVRKVASSKTVKANSESTFIQGTGITENLRLWSIDDPYLYRVQTLVYQDNQLMDAIENKLGIRKIEFVDGKGLLINGENVELVGVNKHQQYPFIGDAVANSFHRKDAEQFKDTGYNVVRLAHYPHDNAFIDTCDELGILLMEEAPTWLNFKEGEWFDNLEESTRIMIRNHRNHPSIFLWSAGINHRGPVESLQFICKEEDPTRMTGSNGAPWNSPVHSGVADIYTPMDYQNMPITEDDFSFLCEHGSSPEAYLNQFEVSKSRGSANRFGVALWTAHDYFSFKKNWGMRLDRPYSIYRVPNPVNFWYKSEMTEIPMVYITDQRAGDDHTIHVFSNCDEVALYNNGKLVARQKPDTDPTRINCLHPSYTFMLSETKGDLVAKGFIRGKEVTDYTLNKAGKAYQIKLEIEEQGTDMEASGADMRMVRAYILDKNGNHVTTDSTFVTFEIKGNAAELIGGAEIGANPNKAYYGTASIIVRSTLKDGTYKITAKAVGLKSDSVEGKVIPYYSNVRLNTISAVMDYPMVKVDLGNEEQLLQFEWERWSGNKSSTYSLKDFGEAMMSIEASKPLEWTSGHGLLGNQPYVAMDGVIAEKDDQLILTLENLPAGEYMLKTYHHSMKQLAVVKGTTILEKQLNTYQLYVNDRRGKRLAVPAVEPTSSNKLGNLYPSSANMQIYSDGTSPIKVVIENYEKDIPIILNGIELRMVKKELTYQKSDS
ncbi:glycoside hydrolase family 2 TIM barrel-domain containing protein [Limibacter armeniacum]|uniref:glycoside hydrolase family 2 protein n=1 Tax=Limibacter armeniacum TaxID=466084 RepID=UPI002FE66D0C